MLNELYTIINAKIVNIFIIGVPFPSWLKDVLIQVSDCVNKSTPKEIINWIKKTFNIDILGNKSQDTDDKNYDNNL